MSENLSSKDLSKAIDKHIETLKVAKESKLEKSSKVDYSEFDPSEYKNPFKVSGGDEKSSSSFGIGTTSGTAYGASSGSTVWDSSTTSPGGGYVTTTPGVYVPPPTSWGTSFPGTSFTPEKEESTSPKEILEMVDNLKIEILEDVLDDLEDAKNTSEIVRVIAKLQRKLKRLKKEEDGE